MREKRPKYRQIAATASVSVAVVLFVALGGVGRAQSAIVLGHGAQSQSGKKVTICHKGKNTISISVNAWPAHLRHGDTEGPCAVVAAAESTELSSTGKTKKSKDEKGTSSAFAGGQEKGKPAKSKSKKNDPLSAAGTSEQSNTAPATSPKPKKQKPTKSEKGGSASPPGLGGASPPGHANGQGKGNGNGKGNGKNK